MVLAILLLSSAILPFFITISFAGKSAWSMGLSLWMAPSSLKFLPICSTPFPAVYFIRRAEDLNSIYFCTFCIFCKVSLCILAFLVLVPSFLASKVLFSLLSHLFNVLYCPCVDCYYPLLRWFTHSLSLRVIFRLCFPLAWEMCWR